MRGKKSPKNLKKRPDSWEFPPDIFWISPDGIVIEVIGHLTAIQAKPDVFGFAHAPKTKKEIDRVFHQLWEAGWIRGRYSSGVFHFQMERPRGVSIGAAYELVLKFAQHAAQIIVDFVGPHPYKTFTAQEFLEQRFPASWGLNPSRRKKHA